MMDYPRCWSSERVREVLTTESRQKARDLFLQTHRPFRRIRVDFCKERPLAGTFITEEQVRATIQSGSLHDHNRLFFITGEAGSGKSELCQWLDYTVDQERSLPIHIPRSMTSAAHVVALLRQHLAGSYPLASRSRAPVATQAESIAWSAVVLLYEQQSAVLMPLQQWERLLTSRQVKEAIATHLAAATNGQWDHRLLASEDAWLILCEAHGISVAPEHLPRVCQAGCSLLERAMEQTLWTGDVRGLLTQMSEAVLAQGRRPLLLLEDVTAFRVLGDRLLDYLLDLTSGHVDAVIGLTTGFEQTQLAGATLTGDLTHIHHRLRGRLVLTDDEGRAYGLEDEVVELARVYLDAVKAGNTGNAPGAACAWCSHQPTCERVFGNGLYPFTETALLRAFYHLHEEGNPRQTPRLLLEHVLGAVLLADTPPPLVLEQSPYLTTPPTLFRGDDIPDGPLHALLRWYGQVDETSVMLDASIAEMWGIAVPSHVIHQGQVCVPRAYVAAPPDQPAMSSDWQQELRELQRWLREGGLYPNRETLKQGIERVLMTAGDPRSLSNPHALSLSKAEITYARGDERIPIFLGRDSGDQPVTRTALKVRITGTPEERGILEELAYLALSQSDIAQVCRNPALTMEWARQHWESYHAEIRDLLQHHLGGISVENLILIAWKMLTALHGMTFDPLSVAPLEEGPATHYATTTPWSATDHAACYVAGEHLAAWYETVRRLFIGMFLLRDTLLDRERYEDARTRFDPSRVIEQCAALSLDRLRTLPFRIRPMGQKLPELLGPLQRYAAALMQIESEQAIQTDLEQLEAWRTHLESQRSLDRERLTELLTTLRWRCGEVGVVWPAPRDGALDYLAVLTMDDIQDLHTQVASLAQTTREQHTVQPYDLWQYQSFRHALRPLLRHPYWAALATLRTIQHTLLATARGRYTARGKTLTGTPPYHACLQRIRAIRQELRP
jgi:hypothetical protein